MNKSNRNYTDDDVSLLSGQIQGAMYLEEVQTELKNMGKCYSDGYVHRVVGRFSYNNDIWDAVKAVLIARRDKKRATQAQLQDLAA